MLLLAFLGDFNSAAVGKHFPHSPNGRPPTPLTPTHLVFPNQHVLINLVMLKSSIAALVAFFVVKAGASPIPVTKDQLKPTGSGQVVLLAPEPAQIGIRFDDPGWNSGVTVLPPAGQAHWDLSQVQILSADVENCSPDKQLRLTMHISSGVKADKTLVEVGTGVALNPGEKRTLNLRIPHRVIYGTPAGVP